MKLKLKLKVYFYLITEYLFMLNLTIVLLIIRTTREIFSSGLVKKLYFPVLYKSPGKGFSGCTIHER